RERPPWFVPRGSDRRGDAHERSIHRKRPFPRRPNRRRHRRQDISQDPLNYRSFSWLRTPKATLNAAGKSLGGLVLSPQTAPHTPVLLWPWIRGIFVDTCDRRHAPCCSVDGVSFAPETPRPAVRNRSVRVGRNRGLPGNRIHLAQLQHLRVLAAAARRRSRGP